MVAFENHKYVKASFNQCVKKIIFNCGCMHVYFIYSYVK